VARNPDASGRNRDRLASEDRVVILRRSFWHAPHLAAAGGAARALIVELQSMFNGTNNGKLYLSVRDAADRLGFTDLEAAQKAMAELEALGLVTITIESSFAMKAGETSRARAYRLNWIGDDGKCLSADRLPALDFASLSARQKKRIARRSKALGRYLKERKSAVRETRTLMTDSVRETRTGAADSVRETPTLADENVGIPPSHRVRESLTHILHHIPSSGTSEPVPQPGPDEDDPDNPVADATSIIRAAIIDWWRLAPAKDRVRLAKNNGLELLELQRFIDGVVDLAFPKLVALRSAIKQRVAA